VHVASSDRGDLVDHQKAVVAEAVPFVGSDQQAHQGRFNFLAGRWADRERVSRIEAVVLDNQGRPRLARIDTAGEGDDLFTSFVPVDGNGLDEVHVVTRPVSGRDECGLAVSFGGELGRADIGYPDLDWP
jgi:hypothetical protein